MPIMDGFEMCSEIVKNYTDFIETIGDNQMKQILLETKPFIVMITAYQGEKFL
jgi:CheY-like chemotaxis protein